MIVCSLSQDVVSIVEQVIPGSFIPLFCERTVLRTWWVLKNEYVQDGDSGEMCVRSSHQVPGTFS